MPERANRRAGGSNQKAVALSRGNARSSVPISEGKEVVRETESHGSNEEEHRQPVGREKRGVGARFPDRPTGGE